MKILSSIADSQDITDKIYVDNAIATNSPVLSVNGQTGTVVLTQDDVGSGTTYVQTENNFTDADVTKLSGIAAGAQVNVIESVQQNGTALTITNKAVNVTVPTKTSDITNDIGYITSAQAPVQSVNGYTGTVVLTKSDVGLGNVDNTSDANKPISTATQAALDTKYSSSNPPPYPVTSVNGQTGAVTITNITGNAATATSLQTTRTISADTAVSATPTNFNGTNNITIPINSVYASYTAWGGKNLSGTVSPVDVAINNEFSANRLSFMTPSDILIEYSNDGGSTWSTYSTTDSAKQSLVTLSSSYYIGGHSSSVTLNDKLRVTLTAANGVLYTSAKQIQLQTSSNGSGGGNVTLEAKTIANYNTSTDTWSTLISNQSISGWSGWNVLNTVFTFGGGTTQTSQYRQIRFTFGITSLSGTFSNALQLLAIRLYGENLWSSTNNYQRTGHIYSFDVSQNATFPAQVTSTQFNGPLNGNAATSTQFASAQSVALTGDITGSDSSQAGWSVATTLANSGVTAGSYGLSATATPAFGDSLNIPYITFDAKGRATSATNHTLTIPSTLASTTVNGLMSSSDKTKLNGIESGAQVNTVTSVNSKTGAVVLTASDVGALPSTTTYVSSVNGSTGAVTITVPTKTSQLTNDSNFITASQAPVQSVDGLTGAVVLNDVKYTSQTLTTAQQTQARTNIGAGTSSFSGSYTDLTNKPTIPSKTSELTNDSGFITSSQAPVQSVNSKTGAVVLSASDVGALPSTTTYVSSVNGNSGAVTITVPTKTSDLTNDNGFLPTTITSPANGQIIAYNGTAWINQSPQSFSQQQANWAETSTASIQYIQNKPTALSAFTNDTNYITASGAPVQSVDGLTGSVVLNDVKYTTQTLTTAQQTQARSNIGAGTSSFSGSYTDLTNKPTIPTATSQLTNDSNFITASGAPVQSVNGQTGTVNITTITGNSGTATTLETARTIALSGGATGTATSFNGSANITIPVTSLDATTLSGTASISTTGNASTATTLQTARTIGLSGVTATAQSFNGSTDITIPITAVPASIVTGTLPVTNGGTGTSTLASGQALIGNGTGAVSTCAIDTTAGGTSGSTSLITSGAVYAGIQASAGGNVFIATYGTTTTAEIESAYQAGKIVLCKNGDRRFALTFVLSLSFNVFFFENIAGGDDITYSCANDAWSTTTTTLLPVSGGTMTGSLYLSGNPTEATEASTKSYVDTSITTALNRSTAINVADTNYTTTMARGTALYSADTSPTINGTINWTYA